MNAGKWAFPTLLLLAPRPLSADEVQDASNLLRDCEAVAKVTKANRTVADVGFSGKCLGYISAIMETNSLNESLQRNSQVGPDSAGATKKALVLHFCSSGHTIREGIDAVVKYLHEHPEHLKTDRV